MTLTELRYIVAVARERHFGRAAQSCFVSQPTLSIAIKKLEDELGVTLFERGGQEVSVTEIGERIIEQSQRVLEEAETVKRLAGEHQNELVGPLKLGVIFTISPYLLPRLIPALRILAPDMPLILEENYTSRLSEMLKRGEVDAIIVADPFDEAGTVASPLYDEPFVVATPKGHPWEKLGAIAANQLADESVLLLTQGNCFRDQVLQACSDLASRQSHGGTLAANLQGSSLNTIRHMVASGMGVTVMPSTSIGPTDESLLSVVPFKTPAPQRRVLLVTRKQFFRKKAIDTLQQAVFRSGLEGVSMLEGATPTP
ncbi:MULTISPECIES: LysR substrate-binding domain-containing protein [Chromobacterium]|uniref:Hydrogen peroxid-inducible genes activator OxyR n=3 Tax=Chromobacterium TaxID=535 RepID=A4ZPZ1_CHRVL|nr:MULTISPECIES: LysR substrate-binding domain-containing protein [Chromobacterium]ABP57755.1 hydrogen peroxid-inducible genes activator OxyR [Chromobacterium violaceum]AXT47643.1 LysR family transcriptional regulator [Chromobacterium rhizoryzae]MBK0415442.1 LysR family transcriptional regulator [Chromobacterium haemolyticum]MBO0416823.1 LysR family transcriptional regulator [Chromobacterium haemolyticum]MBO0499989.1 LysR family transcriptional regulator [Chromobacterium haemolyticum]